MSRGLRLDFHAGPSEIVVSSTSPGCPRDRGRISIARPSTTRMRCHPPEPSRRLASAVARELARRCRRGPAPRAAGHGCIIQRARRRGRSPSRTHGARARRLRHDSPLPPGSTRAGTVFVGTSARRHPRLCAGSNHVLPTAGPPAAWRLSAADFVRFHRTALDAAGSANRACRRGSRHSGSLVSRTPRPSASR